VTAPRRDAAGPGRAWLLRGLMAAAAACWAVLVKLSFDLFDAIGQLRDAAALGGAVETVTRSAAPAARATAGDSPLAQLGDAQAGLGAAAVALPHLSPEALLRVTCLRGLVCLGVLAAIAAAALLLNKPARAPASPAPG